MTLIATWIDDITVGSNADKYENKGTRHGALNLFKVQTDSPQSIITPELKAKVAGANDQTINSPVLNKLTGITIGTSLPAVIADVKNTSAYYVVSPFTAEFGFTQVPTDFDNNEIAMQKDFENKLVGYLNLLANEFDQAAVAALAADKTQIFNNTLDYTAVGNVLTATKAQGEELIGDLSVVQEANDFFDQQYLVGNANIQSIINRLAESSTYNDQMKDMRYMDKILSYTNNIANAALHAGTGYLVNEGSVGLVQRFEREALRGTKLANGTEWGMALMPIINMMMSTYYYESVGDQSGESGTASANNTRAVKRHYSFAMDIAFLTSYNSDPTTYTNPILAFQIATT